MFVKHEAALKKKREEKARLQAAQKLAEIDREQKEEERRQQVAEEKECKAERERKKREKEEHLKAERSEKEERERKVSVSEHPYATPMCRVRWRQDPAVCTE